MTVADLFREANLPFHDPVPWGTPIRDPREGIYVVARVGDPAAGCQGALPFKDPLPPHLVLDLEYERQRWLPNEPVLYVGRGARIDRCIAQFYRHKVGTTGSLGGQMVKLLECDQWVYWAPTNRPRQLEPAMISAFEKQVGKRPFANGESGRPKRVRCLGNSEVVEGRKLKGESEYAFEPYGA
jgi:hypothetical protein